MDFIWGAVQAMCYGVEVWRRENCLVPVLYLCFYPWLLQCNFVEPSLFDLELWPMFCCCHGMLADVMQVETWNCLKHWDLISWFFAITMKIVPGMAYWRMRDKWDRGESSQELQLKPGSWLPDTWMIWEEIAESQGQISDELKHVSSKFLLLYDNEVLWLFVM